MDYYEKKDGYWYIDATECAVSPEGVTFTEPGTKITLFIPTISFKVLCLMSDHDGSAPRLHFKLGERAE